MSNQVVDHNQEEFDITDAIERSFEDWYGQQSTQAVGEWYNTPNCFLPSILERFSYNAVVYHDL